MKKNIIAFMLGLSLMRTYLSDDTVHSIFWAVICVVFAVWAYKVFRTPEEH